MVVTVRENGVPNAVAPPKVSQRRAQPCAAVRRRIDTASSRAMIVLMCSLALCDQAQRMTARRKRLQVTQNQTWGCLDRRRCRDDVREGLWVAPPITATLLAKVIFSTPL